MGGTYSWATCLLVDKKKITVDESNSFFGKIQFAANLLEFNNCDLIIEAVLENLEIKQALFADLEKIVSSDCILATNTSSLSITSIAGICKNPERVIGIHFLIPYP